MAKAPSVYVPLDVNYMRDPKIRRAGPDAELLYLRALAYARERAQGRPLDAKDPAAPPVPIIEHADVRRDDARLGRVDARGLEVEHADAPVLDHHRDHELGPRVVPYLSRLGAESEAGSPQRATSLPGAPVFLLHGDDDTVIPAVEGGAAAPWERLVGTVQAQVDEVAGQVFAIGPLAGGVRDYQRHAVTAQQLDEFGCDETVVTNFHGMSQRP